MLAIFNLTRMSSRPIPYLANVEEMRITCPFHVRWAVFS